MIGNYEPREHTWSEMIVIAVMKEVLASTGREQRHLIGHGISDVDGKNRTV